MAATRKAKVVLAHSAVAATLRPPQVTGLGSGTRASCRTTGTRAVTAYRARLRYQGLLQDYRDLAKESEAKKRKLHMKKLKKQRLLAEVKFLRKRFKSMSRNPSQIVVCRVRNPAMPPVACIDVTEHRSVHAVGSSSKGPPKHRKQYGLSNVAPVIDLNEACELGYGDEMELEGNHGYREPLSIDKALRYPVEGDVVAGPSNVRMPTFWDVRLPEGRPGKRKISLQDQLALRV